MIFLSILNTGEGEFEIPFIRDHLTSLENFYGVEVREHASKTLGKQLQILHGQMEKENRKLEVQT